MGKSKKLKPRASRIPAGIRKQPVHMTLTINDDFTLWVGFGRAVDGLRMTPEEAFELSNNLAQAASEAARARQERADILARAKKVLEERAASTVEVTFERTDDTLPQEGKTYG